MRRLSIDQRTIDRAIDGDKEAYATLVQARSPRFLIVAERILRSPEDAVSAAQKLFVLAYANLKKLKELGTVEMWLMQNLVRLCGESLKDATKKGRALLVECDFPKDLAEAGLLDTIGVVEAADRVSGAATSAAAPQAAFLGAASGSVAARRREAVRKAVDCLPFLERTAVIFRDWDGMSYLEVAEILRVKQDDMRKLLVRGRKGVAEMLAPRGGQSRETPAGSENRAAPDSVARTTIPDKKTAREIARRLAECEKLQDKIWLLVGGEVGPTEQAVILTHVGACSACNDAVRRASIVLEAIRDAAPLEDKPLIAPEMLWKEVEPLLAR
jgi:RNA polymerase sigma-70 factor (ECF subfamily)